MKKPKILSVFSGKHEVHIKYAESLHSDKFFLQNTLKKEQSKFEKIHNLIKSSNSIPKNYDYYLCENAYYYPAFAKKFTLLKGKIINLNTGPLFYNLNSGKISGIERDSLKHLAKTVDGFLVQGDFGLDVMEKLKIKAPKRVIYPFISNSIFKKLKSSKPKLNNYEITMIATNDVHYKGLDLLIEAFLLAKEKLPKLKLNIVGNISHDNLRKLIPKNEQSIRVLGFVKSIKPILEKTSLYVHPARGETFGVAVLEAMLAGIPTIVSVDTGAKEAVREVDKSLIVELYSTALAEKIVEYFSLSKTKKLNLSKKCKRIASKYNEKDMLKHFKKQFYSLLEEI